MSRLGLSSWKLDADIIQIKLSAKAKGAVFAPYWAHRLTADRRFITRIQRSDDSSILLPSVLQTDLPEE